MNAIESFRNELMATPDFIDPRGKQHHEFVSGKHGRKMDFSVVKKGTELYQKWLDINKQRILYRHPNRLGLIILGVANGTTDFAFDLAKSVSTNYQEVFGLRSEKLPDKQVRLTQPARWVISDLSRNKFIKTVIIEDVGTTGTTAGKVAQQCLEAGAEHSEVIVTWQRTQSLGYLDENKIPYSSIITEVIPTLSPELCEREGDCARGVTLKPHGE